MSVSVGFSPVPAGAQSTLTGDAGTAASAGTTGDGSLFAQLLALLGGGTAPTTGDGATTDLGQLASDAVKDAVTGAANAAAGTTATTIVDPTLSVPETTDPNAGIPANIASIVEAAKQLDTTGGKSLLKSLADALTALNDSLEAGDTPDPRQLSTVDDLASVLAGLLAQAQPALAQATQTAAADGSTISGVDATSGTGDLAATLRDLIAALSPEPAGQAADKPATTPADASSAATTDTAAPSTDTAEAATTTDAPAAETDPVMAKLAAVLDEVAGKLGDKAPALAEKLTALGKSLEASPVTTQVLDALGLSDDAASEIADLVKRIADPKPAATPKSATTTDVATFTPPSLSLPEVAKDKTSATSSTNGATSAATAASTSSDAAAASEDAPRADVTKTDTRSASDAKPVDRAVEAAKGKAETEAGPDKSARAATDTPDGTGLAAQASTQVNAPAPIAARTAQGAYQAQSLVPSLPQVAFEIARHVEAGTKRFQIRLDPPELGRIDVRLSVDNSGTVQARMTVERAETLDLMQRDQRALQQALQQAGLDTSKTNLEFSLSQNGSGRNGQPFSGWADTPISSADAGVTASDAAPAPVDIYRGTATQRGLNLFV